MADPNIKGLSLKQKKQSDGFLLPEKSIESRHMQLQIVGMEHLSQEVADIIQNAAALLSESVGDIIIRAVNDPPYRALLCNGQAVSRAQYPALFAKIRSTFGHGDGTTTFNVPDYRGRFLRMINAGSSADPNAVGRTGQTGGTFAQTCSTVSGSPNVTVPDTSILAVGISVTGTGIPANTRVRQITGPTTIVLGNRADTANVNASATNASVNLTFGRSALDAYAGSRQSSEYASHSHTYSRRNTSQPFEQDEDSQTGHQTWAGNNVTLNTGDSGGSETRPLNTNIAAFIRY